MFLLPRLAAYNAPDCWRRRGRSDNGKSLSDSFDRPRRGGVGPSGRHFCPDNVAWRLADARLGHARHHQRDPEAGAAAEPGRDMGAVRTLWRRHAGGGRAGEAEQRTAGKPAPVYAVRPGALQVAQGARGRRRGQARRRQRPEEFVRAAGDAANEPLQPRPHADLPGRSQGRGAVSVPTTAGASSGPTADSCPRSSTAASN